MAMGELSTRTIGGTAEKNRATVKRDRFGREGGHGDWAMARQSQVQPRLKFGVVMTRQPRFDAREEERDEEADPSSTPASRQPPGSGLSTGK